MLDHRVMPEPSTIRPARRPDLVLRPFDSSGRHVVKDLRSGAYFNLGAEESFLLSQCNGTTTAPAIRTAFEARFKTPLSADDMDGFLELAREQRFLLPAAAQAPDPDDDDAGSADAVLWALQNWPIPSGSPPISTPSPGSSSARPRQSLLFWRVSLYDPDRLFNWLEPKVRFVWTRAFLVLSGLLILSAGLLFLMKRREILAQFPRYADWKTLLLAWLVLAIVTTCHEFAHGLTCKHYGGEVHEVGFLLMYFMPCFFCNVSDAWLFDRKAKRLWVTLAGGWCDLIAWSLGVLVWRVTTPSSLLNYAAWLTVSICGFRILLNFNPLMKLDGYYLLCDWVEMPNLRSRSRDLAMRRLRALLWGAERPSRESRGRFLLAFGLSTWVFSLVFLTIMLFGLNHFLKARGGVLGTGWAVLLGTASARRLFKGFTAGEVKAMILTRRSWTTRWALGLAALSFVLVVVPMEDRASGPLQFRPATRAEVRATVTGFVTELQCDEGDRVSPGGLIAVLDVPDLASKIAQKRAEVREVGAKLKVLEIGSRPEAISEQRERVARMKTWRDLGRHDLSRTRMAFREEMTALDEQIKQGRAEHDRATDAYRRDQALLDRRTISLEQVRASEKTSRVSEAQLRQAEANHRAREAEGALKAEAELALREKLLADDESALRLLEAGARPEEIDAERAHLARLVEEAAFLDGVRSRVRIMSPVAGVVSTPRLKERTGQYLREGELICEIESPTLVEAEISLPEQDVARVRAGQRIDLKARALPFQTFVTKVERIAPRTARGAEHAAAHGSEPSAPPPTHLETPGAVVVYCRLEDSAHEIRTGMTGHAWIALGRRPVGEILSDRVLRFIRTEFWW